MHQPGLAIWGLTWCTVIILINGFEVFWNFTASRFLTGCVYQPLNHHFPPNVISIPTRLRRHQHSYLFWSLRLLEGYEENQGLAAQGNGFRHCELLTFNLLASIVTIF